MSRKHLVFVINQKAGVERKKSIQHAIDARLDNEQFTYEIAQTEYANHGTLLARAAAENGAYAVVAIGGDGSVNDIAAGLLHTNTALAIIPKGSGNGMARTLRIPLNDLKAIDVINGNNTIHLDIDFANDTPFISNAGVGFDALIAQKFRTSTKRGLMVYSWLVTKHLWTYRERNWKIEIDGKQIQKVAFIVNVANGKQFGYNFQIAPEASYTDGLLDIIIIKKFPRMLGGALVLRALNGTLPDSPYVDHYRGSHITVSHPHLDMMQTDGDMHPCTDTVHFTVAPRLQKVIVP